MSESKLMLLSDIQKLQFSNKAAAERAMLDLLRKSEDASIEKIELQPKPESLNSINGFVTFANKDRYFFKTHTEENEKISEYYNATALAAVGYPVVTPRQVRSRPGQQIVFYEIISYPTLFDLIKIEEDAEIQGKVPGERLKLLVNAQEKLDGKVFEIYQKTLRQATAAEQARAPIHQLFSYRLNEDGRVGMFYRGKTINLDNGQLPFEKLANMKWIINGVSYSSGLEQIIERSKDMLTTKAGVAIVGHGDAHNGNVFVDIEDAELLYFDPAFAGLHDPLLDMAKPLFHNIFARWMYFPEQVASEFKLTCEIKDNRIVIEHDYQPTQLRKRLLQSKIENTLKPTLRYLQERNLLSDNWQDYLRSALFCCPFLTVNLFAPYVANGTLAERYGLSIKLLGLSMAVELGSTAHKGSSYLTDMIDSIFA